MENFFSLLQKNMLDCRRWDTREELRIAIVTWIERTYHRRRHQGRSRTVDPDRIRSNHDHTGQSGRVTETVTYGAADPISHLVASTKVVYESDPGLRSRVL